MKEVMLHKLDTEYLMVYDDKEMFEFTNFDVTPVQYSSPTEYYNRSLIITKTPIKQICIDGQKTYHCFDPKLEKIMKSYYGVHKLESEIQILKINIDNLKTSLKETQDRELNMKDQLLESTLELHKYRNMSLWKRIVFLFKGDV